MSCFLGSPDFVSHKYLTSESLCPHETDESGKVEKGIGLRSKTISLHLHTLFRYISLTELCMCITHFCTRPSLQDDDDVKMPNFTFCGGREHITTTFFFFP